MKLNRMMDRYVTLLTSEKLGRKSAKVVSAVMLALPCWPM